MLLGLIELLIGRYQIPAETLQLGLHHLYITLLLVFVSFSDLLHEKQLYDEAVTLDRNSSFYLCSLKSSSMMEEFFALSFLMISLSYVVSFFPDLPALSSKFSVVLSL